MQLGEAANTNPAVVIGGHPFFDPQHRAITNVVLSARDGQKLALDSTWWSKYRPLLSRSRRTGCHPGAQTELPFGLVAEHMLTFPAWQANPERAF
jgi:hypothetical protein